jgi:hypothetical protein
VCGGTEFSHFPSVAFVQQLKASSSSSSSTSSNSNYFEVLVCRACRKTDLFAKLGQLERLNAHTVIRVPESAPFR